MLRYNMMLPRLMNMSNPPKSVFASGKYVSNIPECQIGVDRNFTHGVEGGIYCKVNFLRQMQSSAKKIAPGDYQIAPRIFMRVVSPNTAVALTIFLDASISPQLVIPALKSAGQIEQREGC